MRPLQENDPRTIGTYRLLGRLGAGGMGRVYLGRSPGGAAVAVKVIRAELADDLEFRTRFRREVDAARRVGAAWSAPVLDADTESPVPWIATGYVAGPPLSEAVAEFGPLPETGVRALGAGLAETLAAVHGLGLIHRDVKPSNVLLALDGPRLIDFGIARAMDASAARVTGSGVVVGSPGYMAPEQVLTRPVGPPCDVFALGSVLAYAAAGHGPFSGDSAAVLLYKVAHEEPELDGVPPGLRDVIEACLAKEASVRPSPAELARHLAPEGAAALVREGWLPARLTGQLAARAVELLSLEAAPFNGFGPASGNGPVGYPPRPQGAFGPPPAAAPPFGPPPFDAPPADDPRRRRGRAVAAVTAVLLTAAVVTAAVLLLRPEDGDNVSGGTPADSTTTASASPSTGRTTPQEAALRAVPGAFIGTWKGGTTTQSGIPGSMEITIKTGKVGAVVAHDKPQTEILGIDCSGDWKLVSVTRTTIVLDTTWTENPHPGLCSTGSKNERFTLNSDGSLHYTSGDKAAGNPEGDLNKT